MIAAGVSGAARSAPAVLIGSLCTGGISPSLTFQPFGGASRIEGAGAWLVRLPALSGAGAPVHGLVSATVFSGQGEVVLLLASLPREPLQAPLGGFWLEPSLLLPLGTGLQGASEHVAFGVQVPPGLPDGLALGLQALSLPAAAVALSNPVVVTLH